MLVNSPTTRVSQVAYSAQTAHRYFYNAGKNTQCICAKRHTYRDDVFIYLWFHGAIPEITFVFQSEYCSAVSNFSSTIQATSLQSQYLPVIDLPDRDCFVRQLCT